MSKEGKTLTQMGLMSASVPEELFECKVHNNKLGEACWSGLKSGSLTEVKQIRSKERLK